MKQSAKWITSLSKLITWIKNLAEWETVELLNAEQAL